MSVVSEALKSITSPRQISDGIASMDAVGGTTISNNVVALPVHSPFSTSRR